MPAASKRPAPRGGLIEADGRRFHVVRAGPDPKPGPLVLLEAGSYGFSADWAVVQAALAKRQIASLAYDRAGLGLSDPGPKPRDSRAVVEDLERLLAVLGESGPLILAGHSMAGLHVQQFAGRNRARVAGVVLVDAITPRTAADPLARLIAAGYIAFSRLHAVSASLGLLKPFRGHGDMIGLTPEAKAHKHWAFAHGPHNRAATAEVTRWTISAAQANAAGDFDPAWPLAVVTAGHKAMLGHLHALRIEPATRAVNGYQDLIDAANHANMLGLAYGERVAAAIAEVYAAATRSAPADPAPDTSDRPA
jgi:pimeloyl-ACP methyl ester carboxylesterase